MSIRRLIRPIRIAFFVLFAVSFALTLGSPALRAQSVPCLVGHGAGPNGWIREDDTPVGRLLRDADALHNDPSPQVTELYRNVLTAAENLPDVDTCKARAFFYAALYFRGSDAEKGLALEQRSVAIDENVLPAGHPRRILDLRDLAGFYAFAHQPAQAERLYQQVVSLLDTMQGLTSLERMFTFMTVADFYEHQKNFSKAEALYRNAVDASASLQPSLRSTALMARSGLARVLGEEGKQDEAHALLNEPTPPILPPPVPGTSVPRPDLSAPMAEIAQAAQYASGRNFQGAEASYLRAIAALEKMNHPAATRYLIATLDGLGELYRQQHRDADSEAVLLRAFRLWEAAANAPGTKRAAPPDLQTLLLIYKDEGRLGEIEPLYTRALEIEEQLPEKNDFVVTAMLTDLAYIYCQERKYEAALPLYQRVLAIHKAKWGPDDPKLASTLDQYAEVLEKLNRPDEAAALRARSSRLTSSAHN